MAEDVLQVFTTALLPAAPTHHQQAVAPILHRAATDAAILHPLEGRHAAVATQVAVVAVATQAAVVAVAASQAAAMVVAVAVAVAAEATVVAEATEVADNIASKRNFT